MAERELGIRLTAEDEASEKIEGVAEAVEELNDDGAEVEVEAETKDARSSIERLADDIEDLTDDGKEVRVEFKARQLERELSKTLRQLEELEDPIEIEAKSKSLQRTIDEMEELNRLAEDIEVDVRVDPKRSARQGADDLENLRVRGEGLQSAIPALRGFGDELGGAAQGAGIASQAVADLGDFALIAGERLGLPEGAATKLGTALGAAGLAGVIGGVAIGALSKLAAGAKKVAERTQEAADTTANLIGAYERLDDLPAISDVLIKDEDVQKVAASLGSLGISIGELDETMAEVTTRPAEFFQSILEGKGVPSDMAAELGVVIDETDNYEEALIRASQVDPSGNLVAWMDENRELVESLDQVQDQVDDLDFGKLADELTATVAFSGTAAEVEALTAALEGLPADATDQERYLAILESQAEAAADAAEHEGRLEQAREASRAATERNRAEEEALRQARERSASASLSSIDVARAYTQATHEAFAAVGEMNRLESEGAMGTEEYAAAKSNAVQAVEALADQEVARAGQLAALEGRELTAAEAQAIYQQSMANSIGTNEELRAAVAEYLAVLGLTPEQIDTILSVETNADEAATEVLSVADGEYEAGVGVETEAAEAQDEIDTVAEGDYGAEIEVVANMDAARRQIDAFVNQARTLRVAVQLTGVASARSTLNSLAAQARNISASLNYYDSVNGGPR